MHEWRLFWRSILAAALNRRHRLLIKTQEKPAVNSCDEHYVLAAIGSAAIPDLPRTANFVRVSRSRIVTLAGGNLIALLPGHDVNLAELTVPSTICWRVPQAVLMMQFFGDFP